MCFVRGVHFYVGIQILLLKRTVIAARVLYVSGPYINFSASALQ